MKERLRDEEEAPRSGDTSQSQTNDAAQMDRSMRRGRARGRSSKLSHSAPAVALEAAEV